MRKRVIASTLILFLLCGCSGASPSATPDGSPSPAPSPVLEETPAPGGYPDLDDLEFEDLANLTFWFSSGAGAWSTEVQILPDGSFTGLYQDSDMGDSTPDYPLGTVYSCTFAGKFSALEKTGPYEYSMTCESLTQEGTPGEEEVADGIRHITSFPYGFDDADVFYLYLPGKDLAQLPEEFLQWVHISRDEDAEHDDVLQFYGLYNAGGQQGFYGG